MARSGGYQQKSHGRVYALNDYLINQPRYLATDCRLAAGKTHPTFEGISIPFSIYPRQSNVGSLRAAVDAAAEFLNAATKPVLIAGGQLRTEKALGAFAGEQKQ